MGMTWLDGTGTILIKGLNPDNETSGVYMRPVPIILKYAHHRKGENSTAAGAQEQDTASQHLPLAGVGGALSDTPGAAERPLGGG